MNKVNVVIEIPEDSKIKSEYDRRTNQIVDERILYGSSPYPLNYGVIREALDWDGDELDALIISDQTLFQVVLFLQELLVQWKWLMAEKLIQS